MRYPLFLPQEFAATGRRLGPDGGDDAAWQDLVDRWYGCLESVPLAGPGGAASAPWSALMGEFARALGARVIRWVAAREVSGAAGAGVVAVDAVDAVAVTGRGARSPRRLVCPPPADGVGLVIEAECASTRGFSARQRRRFEAFCQHCHSALALSQALSGQRAACEDWRGLVDRLPQGVIVLDARSQVWVINQRARDRLAQPGPLCLREHRLHANDAAGAWPAIWRDFQADPLALRRQVVLDGVALALCKLEWAAPGGVAAAEGPGVMILFDDWQVHARPDDPGEVPEAVGEVLDQRFALSARERDLAWQLALGLTLKACAARSGRSIETVRSQLKSVFGKTEVSSQAQLSRLILDLLIGVRWQGAAAHISAMGGRDGAARREAIGLAEVGP